MRSLLVLLLALTFVLSSCATLPGAGGGQIATSRPVCFSRSEVKDILLRIERLKAAVSSCKRGATYDAKKAKVECEALVARWRIEARSCSEKLTACSARRCSKCVLPWVLVGVAGAIVVVVGVSFGYRELTR